MFTVSVEFRPELNFKFPELDEFPKTTVLATALLVSTVKVAALLTITKSVEPGRPSVPVPPVNALQFVLDVT